MTLMDLRKKFKKCISTVHRQGSLSSRNTEFELFFLLLVCQDFEGVPVQVWTAALSETILPLLY